jgi:hypothetical protein
LFSRIKTTKADTVNLGKPGNNLFSADDKAKIQNIIKLTQNQVNVEEETIIGGCKAAG